MAPRIFVNIAAYRDRDCANTIRDLFDKARWPDRVFVGLCWQFRSPDDDGYRPVPVRRQQCRVIEVGIDRSEGVGWATTRAVVNTSLAIIILNFFISGAGFLIFPG